MFIRIPYYHAKKINILASKSCKNKYSDLNKIGNNMTEKICQCCFHFNSPGKWPVWAFAITWCLSLVCLLQTSTWEIQNRKPNWQWCSLWVPAQVLFLWCWFVINIAATGLWYFWLGQSFKNVFSRTEEWIGMKLGTYVPINVVSKC